MDAARKEVDVIASVKFADWACFGIQGILAATKVMVRYEANGSFSGEPDVDVGADMLRHSHTFYLYTQVCCGSTWRFDTIC